MMPFDGDGISASTLSVEISKIGSSRFTWSPTFFSHFDSVPSAIDSPIWGMTTSTRATASPSLVVGADSPATEEPDGYERHDHHPDDHASDHECEPVARRARFAIRSTAG